MRGSLRNGLLVILVLALGVTMGVMTHSGQAAPGKDAQLCHMVFFTLKDNSASAKQKLVDACKQYLDKHPGTVYYSAGVRADEFNREVNDKDFDVALHLVFKDKASHDKYQDDARHLKFIDENKGNWKSVRVFDAYGQP